MLKRRWLTSVLIGLLTVNGVWGQNADLTEAALKNCCVRNELTMDLDGVISVKQNGKDATFPHKAQAKHVYLERYLEINGPVADKAARYYLNAESVTRFNNDAGAARQLRPKCALMMAQYVKEQVVSFAAEEMLTREDMELTEHFNTMAVSGILPGKDVQVGKPWKLPNHVVAALCNLSALTNQNVEGVLVAVEGRTARGNLVGNVQGIDLGAQVAMIINGKFEFDLVDKRIVAVEWNQEDDRKQGPISPSITAKVAIKLKRTPIATPEDKLGTFALVPFPTAKTPPSQLTNIRHMDEKKRFTLQYPREWHVVSPDDGPQLVMRLMEQGDFVAQVTISPWRKADLQKVIALKDFADLMDSTPGWAPQEQVEQKEHASKHHHKIYQVTATGELDGVKTWQSFYLLVGPQGDQVIVTFSASPTQVTRIGTRDLELIRDLVIP